MFYIDDYPMNYKYYQQLQQQQQQQEIQSSHINSNNSSNINNENNSIYNQNISLTQQEEQLLNNNSLSNSNNSIYPTNRRDRRPSIQIHSSPSILPINDEDDNDVRKKMISIYNTHGGNWWLVLFSLISIAIGVLLVIYFQPNFIVRALSNYYNGEVVFYAENRNEVKTKKLVALTIDDAPSRDTKEILEILDEYNVKATFFLIGKNIMRSKFHQNILDTMLDSGHELGNHLWRDEPSINLALDEFERQLIEVDQIINQTYQRYLERSLKSNTIDKSLYSNCINNNNNNKNNNNNRNINNNHDNSIESSSNVYNSQNSNNNNNNNNESLNNNNNNSFDESICNLRKRKLLRPGSGFFNRPMLELVKSYGYTLCLGNVYPHDPVITIPSVNSWYVTATVSPGSVIILHDRDYTAPALRTLLPNLISEGYNIVTLSSLLDIDDKLKQQEYKYKDKITKKKYQ